VIAGEGYGWNLTGNEKKIEKSVDKTSFSDIYYIEGMYMYGYNTRDFKGWSFAGALGFFVTCSFLIGFLSLFGPLGTLFAVLIVVALCSHQKGA